MNSLISRSTVLVAVAIASLLAAATPARAQTDERAIVAAVTKFLDGIRTRDTSLGNQDRCVWGQHVPASKGPDGWKIFQIAATSRTDGCRPVVK